MSQLATHPFWLDGGYDRESVEACPYHHRELHLMASGDVEDATVWPGSEKPAPPEIQHG